MKMFSVKKFMFVLVVLALMIGAISTSVSANSPGVEVGNVESNAVPTDEVQPEYIPFLAGAVAGWYAYNNHLGNQAQADLNDYAEEDLDIYFD